MNDDYDEFSISAALIGGVFLLVLALFIIAIWASPANSHSFYEQYCCSGQDCEPIDEARARIVEGGYLIDGKHYVAEKDARTTPPGEAPYHACFWPNPDTLRCFYRPFQGF